MPNLSKWVGQIHAGDSVAKAAQVTLESRFAAVAHYLPLAANHAEETSEHVHQLRVSTRRSLAAVRMYDQFIPPKQATWFRKRLRRIRKAAGDARDLDVFLQRYEKVIGRDHERFLRQIRKRRRKAQRPIVKIHSQLISSNRFERHVNRLLQSINGLASADDGRLDQWARSRLDHVWTKFVQAIPNDPSDLKALHDFRVCGKELRYAMELFSTLFPPEFRTSLYPLVTQLQDRLGEINDHATAHRRLVSWSNSTRRQRKADYLRELISQEDQQLQNSIERFTSWWTPAITNQLQVSQREMTSANQSPSGEIR